MSESFPFPDPIAAPPVAARPTQHATPDEWARRAVAARARGAWTTAVECGRQAMRLAPFNSNYRDLFTEILYERLESHARTRVAHLPDEIRDSNLDNAVWKLDEVYSAPATPRSTERRPRPMPARAPSLVKSIAWSAVGAVVLIASVGIWKISSSHDSAKPARSPIASKTPEVPAVNARLSEADRVLAAGDSIKAVSLLRDASREFPADKSAVNDRLAVALETEAVKEASRKKYGDAAKLLDEAATLSPLDPDLWQQLGRAQRNQALATADSTAKNRLLASAEKSFQHALDVHSGHPGAMLGLGQVYVAMNDRSKAIEQFQSLLRDAPSSAEAKTAKTSLASLTATPKPAKSTKQSGASGGEGSVPTAKPVAEKKDTAQKTKDDGTAAPEKDKIATPSKKAKSTAPASKDKTPPAPEAAPKPKA